jgi:hypothetical protein
VAIATQWVASTVVTTSSTSVYTTVAATVSSYLRDLVVTNAGPTNAVSVSFGANATAAATASSFYLPPGGSVVLTQCQIPNGAKLYGMGQGGSTTVNVGYATNVAYI